MEVIKRDGRKVEFDKAKISNAVLKAAKSDNGIVDDYVVNLADNIASYVKGLNKTLSVEEIQDIIENKLMVSERKDGYSRTQNAGR